MIKFSEFLILHPVFSTYEAKDACFKGKLSQTPLAALHRAAKSGKIRRLKRGLYQTHPAGMKRFPPPSSLLVTGRLSQDSVLSHHSAFEALGASHSEFPRQATYWTKSPRHKIKILGVTYQPLLHPDQLRRSGKEDWGVEIIAVSGLDLRVTSRERTFVDSLQAPHWVGGWEEFCQCANKFSHLDLDKVLEYASLLNSPALLSRLGFFLETNRERFYVKEGFLKVLQEKKSRVVVPLVVGDQSKGVINREWNLLVPKGLKVELADL